MLKVAIIGCGKIADSHASQIQRIDGCEIVGVCDREPLMARQLYERFPVKQYFSDVTEMLNEARPDVVHITTPPESHFDIATLCLEWGCHVYVEKPLTLHAEEARVLLDLAEKRGRKLTVGHDDQFSHAARRMRKIVATGYLGGPAVHMESHFCYELGNGNARVLLGDANHWVRRLPGRLLHNIISHGIARIAEFMTSDAPDVMAFGYPSAVLKRLGEHEIVDELRVIISDNEQTSAYFTFSSQMRPSLHQFAVYGPDNGILLDQDHESVVRLPGVHYKSYLDKFVPPVISARAYLANAVENLRTFAARDFHPKAGMKCLIESFYRSIEDNTPVPIPYSEILRTAVIMDRIFEQLRARESGRRAGVEARVLSTR